MEEKEGGGEGGGSFLGPLRQLMAYAMAQLLVSLRYKPEGHGFDSRWSHWDFPPWPHYGHGVNPASNRNEYQGCLLEVKAAGA
jgi:hypothetical protein